MAERNSAPTGNAATGKASTGNAASQPVTPEEVLVSGLGRLPQAPSIPMERRRRWAAEMLRREGRMRAVWQLRRLTGFGGSEMGALLASFRGEYNPFSSARDLVAEKLLVALPSAPTADTQRGNRAEPIVRQAYLDMTGGRTDADAMERVSRMRGARHRWKIGSPDDIVLLEGADGTTRGIVDYKVPRPTTLDGYRETGEVSFDYVCQVHHYRSLAEEAGIRIDWMAVVCFDAIAWEPVVFTIEHDRDLVAEMNRAGESYWNDFVLEGVLPPHSMRRQLDVEILPPEEAYELADEIARHRILSKVAKEREEVFVARLKEWVNQAGDLKGARLPLNLVTVTSKRACADVPGLIQRLADYGVAVDGFDIEAFRAPGDEVDQARLKSEFEAVTREAKDILKKRKKMEEAEFADRISGFVERLAAMAVPRVMDGWDVERAAEALLELGGDPEAFFEEATKLSLPRGASAAAMVAEAMKEAAAESVRLACEQLDMAAPPGALAAEPDLSDQHRAEPAPA